MSEPPKKLFPKWRIIALVALVPILLIGGAFAIGFWLPGWPERGQFGDMFGAVNALFSGLAFVGVILTIYLQTQELKLQREELQETQEELRRTANAQEKTQTAMNEQVNMLARSTLVSALIAERDWRNEGSLERQTADAELSIQIKKMTEMIRNNDLKGK